MRTLSAIDAIQPAWDHAWRLTAAPKSWRTALKITAVAFIARLGGCNSSRLGKTNGYQHLPISPQLHALVLSLLVVIVLVALVISLGLFYVSSRMQFVLFDSVLRSDTTVAPIWRRYGRATWYWIGLKVAYVLVAIGCLSPFIVPVAIKFFQAIKGVHGQVNPAGFIVSMLGFIGAIFLIAIVIGIGYTLLADFGLPSMALEGTPLGETVARVWRLMRAEPGAVALFVVMRFVLGFAASIVCVIAYGIVVLVALIPFGAVGGLGWLVFRHAGAAGHVLAIAVLVVVGVLYAVFVVLAFVMLFGYVQLFFQAYALYFLGGRYPLVGAYLEPYVPPVYGYSPPPLMYPPAGPVEGAV